MLRYAALIATAVLLACSASALAAPPPNDNFANATLLSADQTTGAVATQQTLDSATVQPGELSPAPGTQTVWYRFVPTYTGPPEHRRVRRELPHPNPGSDRGVARHLVDRRPRGHLDVRGLRR